MSALDQLLARLKALHPKKIDLSLGRVERLLGQLGEPQNRLPPVVHIAGTNGKGSVLALLKSMLECGGLRVHAYTSPHLVRFNERIALAGAEGRAAPIADDHLIDLLRRVEAANAGDPITFFEITTAAAFQAFAETPADVALIEVGLGGRLDATNVIRRPRITVLTSIAIDHADTLGPTLSRIAAEKAGIIKRGVPTVVARQDDEAMAVIKAVAHRLASPLTIWGEDFDAHEQGGRMVFQSQARLIDLPRPALLGPHQLVNAGTAVAVATALARGGFNLEERAIERGLTGARWPARLQNLVAGRLTAGLSPGSELWLDGAHNPAAADALALALAGLEERWPKPLTLICGLMGHKDAAGFLAPFSGLANRIIAVPVPDAAEAHNNARQLACQARQLGFSAEQADSVIDALRLIDQRQDGVRIVICGSLYLAGHVLALNEARSAHSN